MQGVIGVFSTKKAAQQSLYLLYGVQHRGQESAGLTVAGHRSLRTWKDKGLVSHVFDDKYTAFIHPDDYVFIGCASGENTDNGIAPIVSRSSDQYEFSLVIDGFFPGKGEKLNEEIFKDTLLSYLIHGIDLTNAIINSMKKHYDSYYSLVLAVRDKLNDKSILAACRDARGVRPLYIAKNDESVYIASESAPLDVLENMGEHFSMRKDIVPGSLIMVNDKEYTETQVIQPSPATCVFEWVYFGRPDSVIEGTAVHKARKRLGHALVDTHRLKQLYGINDNRAKDLVVIPVPDSGRSVCTGVAESLGIPADEGVIKNAYLGRTYIIDDPDFRQTASDIKHNIIRASVKDKKVVITDDSIVRGTVSESVAKNLIQAGAKEVDFLVSYAPIFFPCFSDLPDKPLAAQPFKGKSLEEIGALVANNLPSINNVRFNSEENIVKAVGLPGKICTYCISGKNPFTASNL
jgi:amidophosphoribosyltransferase